VIGIYLEHLSSTPTGHSPESAGLTTQTLPYSRVISKLWAKHFYRDGLAIGGNRSKHDTHTSGTDLFD
jgi:hypothetical protein